MKRIYLDYAASTPVDPQVGKVIASSIKNEFGNPSSLHRDGQKSSAAIFKSRRTIAESIGANHEEIIFTGSATEANNLALRGAVRAYKGAGRPRVVVSAIEHESVLEAADDLKRDNAEIFIIPVSKSGIIDLARLEKAINDRTVIVSVMHANNEIGTIQPIEKIAEIIKLRRGTGSYPLFHTDAAQSFQYLDCDVARLGVDLMTLSSQKIYGPKGLGALYIRKPVIDKNLIRPIILGGGQEKDLRSGTENVAGIAGFAEAVKIAKKIAAKESLRVRILRDYAFKSTKKIIPAAELNGDLENRLPNNLNFYFPKRDAHALLVALDLRGVAVSTGAACAARTSEPSPVIRALGYPESRAAESLRITFGRGTTKGDIDYFLKTLKIILQK